MYDLAIIGAGAAGISAAIEAARRGKSVIVFDKNNKPAKKLYATGNGKCNITNEYMDYIKVYNSFCDDYDFFLDEALGDNPTKDIIDFFDGIGVSLYANKNGYYYPHSNQASTVVWAMLEEAKQYNVTIETDSIINKIIKDSLFIIDSKGRKVEARNVLIASGGKSYTCLGGSESGYSLAKNFGHTIIPIRPSLTGLQVYDNTGFLDGVRAKARATLICNEEIIDIQFGEVQFTKKGISGIICFNLSSKAGKILYEGKDCEIEFDFLYDIKDISIKKLYETNLNKPVLLVLNGIVNDKIGKYNLDKEKINPKTKLSEIGFVEFSNIIESLRKFSFDIKALYDYESAQVCAGGVCIDEIDATKMSSKYVDNLYFAGEIIDIDGLCGGYNLTFAILTGRKVGKCI